MTMPSLMRSTRSSRPGAQAGFGSASNTCALRLAIQPIAGKCGDDGFKGEVEIQPKLRR